VGLLKGKVAGVDSTYLRADASMKAIIRKDTEQSYQDYLKRLCQETRRPARCILGAHSRLARRSQRIEHMDVHHAVALLICVSGARCGDAPVANGAGATPLGALSNALSEGPERASPPPRSGTRRSLPGPAGTSGRKTSP